MTLKSVNCRCGILMYKISYPHLWNCRNVFVIFLISSDFQQSCLWRLLLITGCHIKLREISLLILLLNFLITFRLPTPRPGEVLGLVGTNGIGKSTALKILAGKLKPNLGRYAVRTYFIFRTRDIKPTWGSIQKTC